MNKTILLLATLLLFSLSSWQQNSLKEDTPDRPKGSEISIHWELITNNYSGKGLFKSDFTITNNSATALGNTNWELYFTHSPCRKIETDSIPGTLRIQRIAGDLYKITPTSSFPILKQGQQYTFSLISGDFVTKYSEAPGGFYFIFYNKNHIASQPEDVMNYTIGKYTRLEQITRDMKTQGLTSPQKRFVQNQSLSLVSTQKLSPVIPTPLRTINANGTFLLTKSSIIYYKKELTKEASYLQKTLQDILPFTIPLKETEKNEESGILLTIKKPDFSTSPEAYRLIITPKKIVIEAAASAGIFYGIQSLRAMIPVELFSASSASIPFQCMTIEDAPQYAYRGMLLDVARNFTPKTNVLKLIELLSFYKINKLHLHLADDEGWRIEIKSLPELTSVSGSRGHTKNEHDRLLPCYGSGANGTISLSSGYYTKDDFIEILKYANERHIEVIPSINVPGHARAAINAMKVRFANKTLSGDADASKYLLNDPKDKSVYLSVQQFTDNVICPCEEGVYNFLKIFIADMKDIYKGANLSLTNLHICGDEVPEGVWKQSPSCIKFMNANNIQNTEGLKNYFLERCLKIFKEENLTTSFFEDALLEKDSNHSISVKEGYSDYNVRAYSWNNVWGDGMEDAAYKIANKGYPVVLMHATNLYMDFAYTTESDEPGFYWGTGYVDARKIFEYTPLNIYHCGYINKTGDSLNMNQFANKVRLTATGKENIRGIQAALYAETLKYEGMMEYYAFPKVIALAERAWTRTPAWAETEDKKQRLVLLEKDWNLFANKLGQQELPRLDYLQGGVNYRISAPGMIVENNLVQINSPFPGMTIRYTLDGSDPDVNSPIYTGPIKVSKTVKASLFSPGGKRGKVSELNN